MTQAFNPFEGMYKAQTFEHGIKFTPGDFVVQVDKLLYQKTRNGMAFIAELIVTESNNPAHPVGEKRTFYQKMDVDAAFGSLKGFTLAFLGVSLGDKARVALVEPSLDKVLWEGCGEAQSLKGRRARLSVVKTTTKPKAMPDGTIKPGNDFNRHDFSPYTPKA